MSQLTLGGLVTRRAAHEQKHHGSMGRDRQLDLYINRSVEEKIVTGKI